VLIYDKGVFPPAGLDYGWGSGTEPPEKTVKNLHGFVLLLSHLDQDPLFQKCDFKQCFSNCTSGWNPSVCKTSSPGSSRRRRRCYTRAQERATIGTPCRQLTSMRQRVWPTT